MCIQQILNEMNGPIEPTVIAQWDVADLVGVRGMNSKQLWDFISNDFNAMILEVPIRIAQIQITISSYLTYYHIVFGIFETYYLISIITNCHS